MPQPAVAIAAAGALPRLYAPVDHHDHVPFRPDFAVLDPAYLVGNDRWTLQPEVTPDRQAPPAILVHAHDDGHSSEASIAYYLALKQLGIAAELHTYAGGGMASACGQRLTRPTPWPERRRDWPGSQGLLAPT